MKLITNIIKAIKFINEYGIKEFTKKLKSKLLQSIDGIRLMIIYKKIRKLHFDNKISEIIMIYYDNKINNEIKKILKHILHKNKAILYINYSIRENIYSKFEEANKSVNKVSINSFIYNIDMLKILKSINNKSFFLFFPSNDFYNISAYLRKYNFLIVYIIQDIKGYEKELEENIILLSDVVISLSPQNLFNYLRNDIIYINNENDYKKIYDSVREIKPFKVFYEE